jgi:carbamoyltransferase
MSYLGISSGFHDAGITVIDNNGDIVVASHSERYSKKKNDHLLHADQFKEFDCDSLSVVSYYERPWLKQLRQFRTGQGIEWDKLTVNQLLQQQLPKNIFNKIKSFPQQTNNHHLSHAAAGFQTSPYDDATVVVIDAIGEFDTISLWHAEYDSKGHAKYKRLWAQKYPHSMGLFYSAMTKRAGLRPLDEEYILMGMAAYAIPNFKTIDDFIMDRAEIKFKDNLHLGCDDYRTDLTDYQIAASAQNVIETLLHEVMARARKIGKSKNLVYMGGVALNCLANEHIGAYFKNIWIMPNPGDCGSSLGAAALAYGRKVNWTHPYLGTNIPGGYPVNEILDELFTKKIVGVASGRAEFGPRALGNRSLLADPRGPEIKDKVNEIKRRQKFRPFAPIILEEYVNEYFQMPTGFPTSPYMQTVAMCKKPDEFPAIIHKDGTSRVQTVPKDCKSGVRQLLEKWFIMTGCPMLLNTSLNIRGEPMVNDRSDADRFEKLYGVKVVS